MWTILLRGQSTNALNDFLKIFTIFFIITGQRVEIDFSFFFVGLGLMIQVNFLSGADFYLEKLIKSPVLPGIQGERGFGQAVKTER